MPRYWRCEFCGAVNRERSSESESLLQSGQHKTICSSCGTTSKAPQAAKPPPSSLFDEVVAAVADQPTATRRVSTANQVVVLDTPQLWGEDFAAVGKSVDPGRATGKLVERMGDVIATGRSVIDIVSLDAPGEDDHFERMIFDSLRTAIKQTGGDVVIRIILGFVPVEGRFDTWRKRLLSYLQTNVIGCKAPRLYMAQLYSKQQMQWNHAKIMASDGCQAIVGGHNLWWAAYGQHPAVHDLSVHVAGPAAYDAQVFCEYMWNWGGWWLEAYMLEQTETCSKTSWVKVTTLDDKKPVRLFACCPCTEDDKRGQSSSVVTAPLVTPKGSIRACKVGDPELVAALGFQGHSARIMGLARCGQSHLPSTASDLAKKAVIASAQRSLKLCQQDLVFSYLSPFKDSDHLVCQWIAEALLANGALNVQIVVSPRRGWAGAAPYSWTAGASGTLAMIETFLRKLAPSKERYVFAMQSLHVAPFCFTECKDATDDGYAWPNLGAIGSQYPLSKKCVPAPGNHSKCYIADDSIAYVGSDNLYPNSNGEFGYLLEGAAVDDLIASYWDPTWTYSFPHAARWGD